MHELRIEWCDFLCLARCTQLPDESYDLINDVSQLQLEWSQVGFGSVIHKSRFLGFILKKKVLVGNLMLLRTVLLGLKENPLLHQNPTEGYSRTEKLYFQ